MFNSKFNEIQITATESVVLPVTLYADNIEARTETLVLDDQFLNLVISLATNTRIVKDDFASAKARELEKINLFLASKWTELQSYSQNSDDFEYPQHVRDFADKYSLQLERAKGKLTPNSIRFVIPLSVNKEQRKALQETASELQGFHVVSKGKLDAVLDSDGDVIGYGLTISPLA